LDTIETDGGTETVSFHATLPCTTERDIVNDDYGVRSSDQGVSGPEGDPVSFTVTAPSINVGLTRTLDAIVVSDTVHFTATSSTNGTGLSYTWDFGDGTPPTSGVLTASHAYTQDGDYTVVFTATDTCGHNKAATTTTAVNAPALDADFDYAPKPANILVNDTVYFTDTSTTNGPTITGWEWDFGDSSAHASTPDASHTYETAGTYTVTLAVTDALGYNSNEVKTNIVTVSIACTPLISVTFDYNPADPLINSPITFTTTYSPPNASQSITYTWDFGDGVTKTVTSASVEHTYTISGTQSVHVTAYNRCTDGVTHSESIIVAPRRIFLPLVMRNTS
jgi:PKD repeat protein